MGASTPNDIDPTFDNISDYMFIDEGYSMEFCLVDESRSTSQLDDYQYFSGYEESEWEFSETDFTDTDYTTDYETDFTSVASDTSTIGYSEISDDLESTGSQPEPEINVFSLTSAPIITDSELVVSENGEFETADAENVESTSPRSITPPSDFDINLRRISNVESTGPIGHGLRRESTQVTLHPRDKL